MLIVLILTSEFVLSLLGFETTRQLEKKHLLKTHPHSFIKEDNLLGWKLMKGNYFNSLNKHKIVYTINQFGRRITINSSEKEVDSGNKLFLFGCSFTFGQSVSNENTFPYLIQKDLKNLSVYNFGTPGYSLIQMLIQLKQEINNNNIPKIVILNYGYWLNERGAKGVQWLKRFNYHSNQLTINEMNYPFGKIKNQKLDIYYLQKNQLDKDLLFSDVFLTLDLINSFITTLQEVNISNQERIAIETIKEFQKICFQNDIEFLIFCFDRKGFNLIKNNKINDLRYSLSKVDISKNVYNCSPEDPSHPNNLANKIYKAEIIHSLKYSNILQR